jgi:ferredoxin
MSFRPRWWIAFMAWIWPATRIAARVYTVPLVGRLLTFLTLPLFSPGKQSLTYVPINQEIPGEASVPLPREIVADLIGRSVHRAIIHRCTCRLDRSCPDHDIDIGCMLMGEGATEIDEGIARHVSVDEALAHLDRALADGLMPLVGRAPIDNMIWGVKNRGKLLTVCFCCRCCCTILGAGRYLPQIIHSSIVAAEGVSVMTDPGRCTGCGACVRECFMGALSPAGGKVVRDATRCKACGRCAAVCPEGAITVTIDHKTARTALPGRIGKFVDFE